jgi:hypothetical protein
MSALLPKSAGVRNTDANDHAAIDGLELSPADADFDLVALGAVKAPVVVRGLSFGGTGTLKVTTIGGGVLTYNDGDLLAGMIHPISVKRVWLTGTSVSRVKVYW